MMAEIRGHVDCRIQVMELMDRPKPGIFMLRAVPPVVEEVKDQKGEQRGREISGNATSFPDPEVDQTSMKARSQLFADEVANDDGEPWDFEVQLVDQLPGVIVPPAKMARPPAEEEDQEKQSPRRFKLETRPGYRATGTGES